MIHLRNARKAEEYFVTGYNTFHISLQWTTSVFIANTDADITRVTI